MKNQAIPCLVVGALALFSVPVNAHTFSFELGGHYGLKAQSDVEHAGKLDYSVAEGPGMFVPGTVFTSMDEKGKFKPEPALAVSSLFDLGSFGLLVGARRIQHTADFDYQTMAMPIIIPGSPGGYSLSGAGQTFRQKEANNDLEVGLRFSALGDRLHLTPHLGYRMTNLTVSGSRDSETYARAVGTSGGVIERGEVAMNGNARGLLAGFGADWSAGKVVRFYGDVTYVPGLDGSMNWNSNPGSLDLAFTVAGSTSIGTAMWVAPLSESTYRIRGNVVEAGVKFLIGETVFLRLGYRDEFSIVSYPGYRSISPGIASGSYLGFPVSSGTPSVVEPITNAVLYGKDHVRRWSGISFGVGGNFDFGK